MTPYRPHEKTGWWGAWWMMWQRSPPPSLGGGGSLTNEESYWWASRHRLGRRCRWARSRLGWGGLRSGPSPASAARFFRATRRLSVLKDCVVTCWCYASFSDSFSFDMAHDCAFKVQTVRFNLRASQKTHISLHFSIYFPQEILDAIVMLHTQNSGRI